MGEGTKRFFHYLEDGVSFQSHQAAFMRKIYAPLCGMTEKSLKSSITPFLSGDIKFDCDHYVTKPVSREDLYQPVRNFFLRTSSGRVFSLLDRESKDSAEIQIGPLWHRLINRSDVLGLELEALNFVPIDPDFAEVMQVTVKNYGAEPLIVTPFSVCPIFGRGLVNKHDHEHVTALLHRTEVVDQGVIVAPAMSFNEEGHVEAFDKYFVFGSDGTGRPPVGIYPTVENFLGETGTWQYPAAVYANMPTKEWESCQISGKEAVGALRFKELELQPGESYDFIMIMGLLDVNQDEDIVYQRLNTYGKVQAAWKANRDFWTAKSAGVVFDTGNKDFDAWMRWVVLQPVFRRIFGCSFLPDHDYGKGGRGWRDLWQDLLSLILSEPGQVRQILLSNFSGVRIDGSNATIIGEGAQKFIADRNAITRVWCDHGAWPLLTVMLYIDQMGDIDILFEEKTYFRDFQLSRTRLKDESWNETEKQWLRTQEGQVYSGSVLEHLLVQNVTQFFNVGEHNMIRLENADWNDGLDMAFERGESVAFTSFYIGNLMLLVDFLDFINSVHGIPSVKLLKELTVLLSSNGIPPCDYDNVEAKQDKLFKEYCGSVQPTVSGQVVDVAIPDLIHDLKGKIDWAVEKIRQQEWIAEDIYKMSYGWFNGYYDNTGDRVEGLKDDQVWMTLTGQVFPLMSGVATDEMVEKMFSSTQAFLKDPDLKGYRLNTDFGFKNYLDLGRAFSFAYGTKENGSIFSHMDVMYSYALYKRGFVRQGFEVLQALYDMADNTSCSRMYPNIPEYFDPDGRGMYCYLTGSASWYVLTLLTQVFGVRGDKGDLILEPKLVKEQFSSDGIAKVQCWFAGKPITVVYENWARKDYGSYKATQVFLGDRPCPTENFHDQRIHISRAVIQDAAAVYIKVVLE